MDFAVFGCSLDALDDADKIAMKLAYMSAVRQGIVADGLARDPYDLLVRALSGLPGITLAGKLGLEPFLTPRPAPDTAGVDPGHYRKFLDSGGCSEVSARLREFVEDDVLPLRPLLVGVDHALTGGVLEALAGSGAEPALLVLDSHFDAIPAEVRRKAYLGAGGGAGGTGSSVPDSYTCGTWLAAVIDRGLVAPGDVVVLGPSDDPGEPSPGEPESLAAYRRVYRACVERGVRVVGKKALREAGIRESIEEALAGLEGRPVYVSLDADVGSGDDVKAVRFLDTIGLTFGEVTQTGRELGAALAARGMDVAGLDIMEVDVHLADIPGSGDRTVEMCAAFTRELLAGVMR